MNSLLTVRQILTLNYFKNHIVLAGEQALNNMVRSAAIIETLDIADRLPKEVIVSTTASHVINDEKMLDWIHSLHDAGVSAVFIKTGRFIDAVPDTVIELADQLPIPIIQSPPDSTPTVFLETVFLAIYQSDMLQPFQFGNSIAFFERCLEYDHLDDTEKATFLLSAEINGYILNQPYQMLIYPDGEKSDKLRDKLFIKMLMMIRGMDSSAFGAQLKENTIIFYHFNTEGKTGKSSLPARNRQIQLCAEELAEYGLKLYVSRKLVGAEQIAAVYLKMVSCIKIDQSLSDFSPESPVTYRNGVLLRALYQMMRDPEICREYVDQILMEPIRNETPLRQKEIRQLLRVIYRNNGRLKDIAAFTNTHINTVQYRIQYIENVYHCNLRDYKTQFELQLALILHALLKERNK